jgi:hypothetical protein
MVGVGKVYKIHPKHPANHYTNICILSICPNSGSSKNTQ